MNSGATTTIASMSTLDDDAWDDLLNFIEERRVIPIQESRAKSAAAHVGKTAAPAVPA
jgi:hypothetical protein